MSEPFDNLPKKIETLQINDYINLINKKLQIIQEEKVLYEEYHKVYAHYLSIYNKMITQNNVEQINDLILEIIDEIIETYVTYSTKFTEYGRNLLETMTYDDFIKLEKIQEFLLCKKYFDSFIDEYNKTLSFDKLVESKKKIILDNIIKLNNRISYIYDIKKLYEQQLIGFSYHRQNEILKLVNEIDKFVLDESDINNQSIISLINELILNILSKYNFIPFDIPLLLKNRKEIDDIIKNNFSECPEITKTKENILSMQKNINALEKSMPKESIVTLPVSHVETTF